MWGNLCRKHTWWPCAAKIPRSVVKWRESGGGVCLLCVCVYDIVNRRQSVKVNLSPQDARASRTNAPSGHWASFSPIAHLCHTRSPQNNASLIFIMSLRASRAHAQALHAHSFTIEMGAGLRWRQYNSPGELYRSAFYYLIVCGLVPPCAFLLDFYVTTSDCDAHRANTALWMHLLVEEDGRKHWATTPLWLARDRNRLFWFGRSASALVACESG